MLLQGRVFISELPAPTADLAAESDSGSFDTDNITSDNTPTFTLVPPEDDFVEDDIITVYVDGIEQDSHTVTAAEELTGSIDFALPSIADGTSNVRFTYTRDGVTSSLSNAIVLTVDTTPAEITGLAFTSDAGADLTYNEGEVIQATVTFDSEQYVVLGVPTLTVNVGGDDKDFSYVSGTGTTDLLFEYTVAAGDNDLDGLSIAANSLGAGYIQDVAGNMSILSHEAVTTQSSHKVSSTVVVINPADPRTSGSDLASYDFASVSFGSTVPGNKLVVIGIMVTATAARTLTSVSIGGSAATIVADSSDLGAAASFAAVAVREVSGATTSGDVNVTISTTAGRCGIVPFIIYSHQSSTPTDTYHAIATDAVATHDAVLDVNSGGVIFIVGGKNGNHSAIWTAPTSELVDIQIGAEGGRILGSEIRELHFRNSVGAIYGDSDVECRIRNSLYRSGELPMNIQRRTIMWGVYEHLAGIIPLHWTVLDLGCSRAPQAVLFKDHEAYIGVDWGVRDRFIGPNTTHHLMSVDDFLRDYRATLPATTFAICCNVPPYHSDAMHTARQIFNNVFTYFPGNHDYKQEPVAQ